MNVYADSSFLVSYYLQDSHSSEADIRMGTLPAVWVTPLNRSELAHAMSQYVFRGHLSVSGAQLAWSDFKHDCAAGLWVQSGLPDGAWQTSVNLAQQFGATLGVRTLDSLHVASALELKAQRFWTFDERQAKLAEAVGISTAA